ncbi:hypothetical protein NPIL_230341, partial [Nephila pilipes]
NLGSGNKRLEIQTDIHGGFISTGGIC